MNTVFEKMEYCAAHAASTDSATLADIIAYLRDDNWRVRYAAAIALGDRHDPQAVPALAELFASESSEPLFSQPEIHGGIHAGSTENLSLEFPEGTTEEMKEIWRRRGRVLQAACLAIGNIGQADAATLGYLHRFALEQSYDYGVRAAACKALAQLALPGSLPILELAAKDEEWCTNTEAKKGLPCCTP